jgi:UDP-N-acetylmuramoyl-tripeptide--D-alanyl-D-alanine ligase
MPTLTYAQLAEMVGGEVVQCGDAVTTSVVIDSREARDGSAFFAIRGERLDGHEFLPQAMQKASGAVVSRVPENFPADRGLVKVADTTVALQELARSIRETFDFLLIAITGSAGKTTTKEMIATLVATERRTWKSWGNFNNQIGAPLCLNNTPDDAEVVVSEVGMNHAGEIAQIAGLVRPDFGVYTNVAPVHIEFFADGIAGIAAAKRELLENLTEGGTVVVNNDNVHVVGLSSSYSGPKVTYGVEHEADYQAVHIRDRGLLGTSFAVEAEGSCREFELQLPGRHNLDNLLAAIATARAVGISWQGIERGIRDIRPAYHRGVILQWRGATIYDDTYNSNPYALGRTLELMAQADVTGRRIAVIGDMLELGERELEFHREAGLAIPRGVAIVAGVGRRTAALLEGAREAGFPPEALHHFETAEDAAAFLEREIREGDLVLLKGSRGVGLDRAVARLEAAR